MNTDIPRSITPDEIAYYQRNGVVLLPAMFDEEWIDLLKKGLDANCDDPTNRSRIWDRDAEGRTMFYDSQAWHQDEPYWSVEGFDTCTIWMPVLPVRAPCNQIT